MQRESEVEAAVSPLLKKGAKDSGHKNLRPVSKFAFYFEDHRESGFQPDLCPRNRKWTVSRITIGVQKCT